MWNDRFCYSLKEHSNVGPFAQRKPGHWHPRNATSIFIRWLFVRYIEYDFHNFHLNVLSVGVGEYFSFVHFWSGRRGETIFLTNFNSKTKQKNIQI